MTDEELMMNNPNGPGILEPTDESRVRSLFVRHSFPLIVGCAAVLGAIAVGCHVVLGGVLDGDSGGGGRR